MKLLLTVFVLALTAFFVGCGDDGGSCLPQTEICDGIDNNCDGQTDEGFANVKEICDKKDNNCDGQTDEGLSSVKEVCDGKDNDCDGETDEDIPAKDEDGDNHYTKDSCKKPNDDCKDNDPTIYGGATEVCDGVDNDCDGKTDEGLGTDVDKDGFYTADSCSKMIEKGVDCNDNDRAVFPGKKEICNDTKDNDCDGQTDGTDTDCGGTPQTDPFEPNNTCGDVANDDVQEITSTLYDEETPDETTWEPAIMEASIDKPANGDDEDWYLINAKESGWDASCIPIIDSADCFLQCLDIAIDLNLPAQADTNNWEVCLYELDGSCSSMNKIVCSTADDVIAWMNEAETDIVGFSFLLPLYYWDGIWGLNDDRSFAVQVKPKTAGALTGGNPYSVYVTVGKQSASCPAD